MLLRVRFKDLICATCARKLASTSSERGLQPDAAHAEIRLPAGEGRPARTVPIQIKHMLLEEIGDGLVRGSVKARVPCISGDHQHDIDISDLYRAPQLHLEGEARCSLGHKMTFERRSAWEYIDDDEYGGVIVVSGILRCSDCHSSVSTTLRSAAPDMLAAEVAEDLQVDVAMAMRVDDEIRSE